MDEPVRLAVWLPPNDGGVSTPVMALLPRYAGFWRRYLSFLIDQIMVSVIYGMLFSALAVLPSGSDSDDAPDAQWSDLLVGIAVLLAFWILVDWIYVAVMERSSWQATIGKRALGTIVTDLAGGRISFGRATGRYFARYLSALFLIGYLIQPFTAKRQALHDLIAGTLVIRAWKE